MPALIAAVDLCITRRVEADRGDVDLHLCLTQFLGHLSFMATRQMRQLRGRGCHLLIITTTQRFYRVPLVANGSGKRLKLAKLPDIFLG